MFDGNHRPRRDVNLSGRRRPRAAITLGKTNFLTATGNNAKSLVLEQSRLVLSRHSRPIHLVQRKLFSSDAAASSTSTPLFLSLPETSYYDKGPRILFPSNIPIIPVSSIADIQSAEEEHFELGGGSQQFVGGMNESDGGVWFVPTAQNSDPLHQWKSTTRPWLIIVESIHIQCHLGKPVRHPLQSAT